MFYYNTYEVSIAQQQFRYKAKKQIYNDYPTMLQSQLRNHFFSQYTFRYNKSNVVSNV